MTIVCVGAPPHDVVSTFATIDAGIDTGYVLRLHGFRSEFVIDAPSFGHYVTESRCMDIDQIRDEALYHQEIAALGHAARSTHAVWRYRVARWWAAAYRAALSMTDTRPEDVIR